MQVIYIDTLFIINLVVNYLILLATAKIAAERASRVRMGLAAALGAGYAVLAVLPGWGFLSAGPMKVVAGAAMVMLVFGGKQGILRLAVIFFAVSAAFGGTIYAVSMVSGGNPADGTIYLPVSLRVLLISFAICYGVLTLVFSRMGRDTGGGGLVRVEVEYRGRQAAFTALVDTGNSLSDPVTGGGALVAETEAVTPLFTPQVAKALTGPLAEEPVELLRALENIPGGIGFYLIPYTAVGTRGAFLLAFRPEAVRIDGKEKKGVAVALSPTRVSDGGRYTALVNGGVL